MCHTTERRKRSSARRRNNEINARRGDAVNRHPLPSRCPRRRVIVRGEGNDTHRGGEDNDTILAMAATTALAAGFGRRPRSDRWCRLMTTIMQAARDDIIRAVQAYKRMQATMGSDTFLCINGGNTIRRWCRKRSQRPIDVIPLNQFSLNGCGYQS